MELRVNHLSLTLGSRTILRDVSFTLSAHDWLMVIGPNGAGKSMLLSCVSGTRACQGSVLLDGEAVADMPPSRRARRIGVLSQQNTFAYPFTVEEVVRMGRYAHTSGLGHRDPALPQALELALAQVGLTEQRHQSVLTLSGGERQRMMLAQVLCQDPDILLLDEMQNHLDFQYQQSLFALMDAWRQQPGHAIVSVVHDLPLARHFATSALLMQEGSGQFGLPEQIMTPQNLQAAWQMDVTAWLKTLYRGWEDKTDERV